ncbi:MAG TPA: hypothetical protein VJZ77_03975 [Blastocatellia bacterium]|nr:hypothetical protein [Blastocatellia bacterium]
MEVLRTLSFIVPFSTLIIWIIGVVLALSRWRRHPRVSLFALLAFAIMIVSVFLTLSLPPIAIYYGWVNDYGEISPILFTASRLFTGLTNIIVWVFVLRAIFGWRDGPQKQNLPPPSPSTFGDEPARKTQRYEFRTDE